MTSRYISLRVKLAGVFIAIVVCGTAVGTFLGSQIVTSAMLEQAQRRVEHGLETARMIYTLRVERVQRSVHRAATKVAGLLSRSPDLGDALFSLAQENALDYLGVADLAAESGATSHERGPPTTHDFCRVFPCDAIVRGQQVTGTLVLPEAFVRQRHPGLLERVRVPLRPGSDETLTNPRDLSDALVLFAAEPVSGGKAVVYGGVILNRHDDIVDQIETAVFGGETFQGRRVGTATVFLRDVRVATTVMLPSGERAQGTVVSPEVATTVLGRGERWLGRALVIHDWYVAAYEPLKDASGQIVGMLCVAVLEAAYLAVRTRMMTSFLWLAGAGILVVLALTVWFTRRMTRPLMEMVNASKRVAEGDLTQPVEVVSRDEIGHLAASFNRMQTRLAQARAEVEEWTRTLEDRVRQRTEELVSVQSRMIQAERLAALGRMAAGVAHEINNPLGGILTFAMLALEDCPPDHPLRRNLEVITNQTLRCREIVKGLLDFSRQSEAAMVETDVSEVTERTLAMLEKQPSFQNIRVVRRITRGTPPVLVDPGQWQQVVVNLVVNAVDAMGDEGELTIETGHDLSSGEVFLRVSDTGHGIPDEVLPNIFEPFFTTKEVGKGTGLGLAIVHGIVTRAGGRIDVQTSPQGTTFTVRLPVARRP